MLLKDSLISSKDDLLQDLVSTGVCVIDNALNVFLFENLVHESQDLADASIFKNAGTGKGAQENRKIRGDQIVWHDPQNLSLIQSLYLEELNLLRDVLNRELYLGLQEIESQYAYYEVGQFYREHRDQFSNEDSRKISVVYYLNPHWLPEFGGELIIRQGSVKQTISPLGNRMVIFKSELLHEVLPAVRDRYSVAAWLKTKK